MCLRFVLFPYVMCYVCYMSEALFARVDRGLGRGKLPTYWTKLILRWGGARKCIWYLGTKFYVGSKYKYRHCSWIKKEIQQSRRQRGLRRRSWKLIRWKRRFKFRLGHGCLSPSFYSVLFWVGRGLFDGLITHPNEYNEVSRLTKPPIYEETKVLLRSVEPCRKKGRKGTFLYLRKTRMSLGRKVWSSKLPYNQMPW
jgi:hypothetical protein